MGRGVGRNVNKMLFSRGNSRVCVKGVFVCICADIIFRLSPFSKGVGKKGGVQPCNKEGKRGRGLHGHLSSGYLTHMPHTQTYEGLYVIRNLTILFLV